MASQDPTPNFASLDDDAVIAAHRTAATRYSRVRTIGPIVLATVVAFNVWTLVSAVQNIDTDAVVAEISERADAKLRPQVQADLIAIATNIQPDVERALSDWAADFAPRLETRLNTEVRGLETAAMADLERIMNEAIASTERRNRAIIALEMPEIADDKAAQDTVLATVQAAAAKWGARQYSTTFHAQVAAMDRLRGTLDAHYRITDGHKAPKAGDVLALWLEIMGEQLGGDDTILATPKTEAKTDAEPAKGQNG